MQLHWPLGELAGEAVPGGRGGRDVHERAGRGARTTLVRDLLAILRHRVAEILEMGQRQVEIGGLTVFVQMLEVGAQRGDTFGDDAVQGGPLIVGCGFTPLDGDGALRALAHACPQPVAGDFADQPCLAVDYLQRALGAALATDGAPVAFALVDPNDLALHQVLRLKLDIGHKQSAFHVRNTFQHRGRCG